MELGGVSVYLSEIATPGHKGFYVSWQSGSSRSGHVPLSVGVVLSSSSPEKMTAWGGAYPASRLRDNPFCFGSGARFRRPDESSRATPADDIRDFRSLTANWAIVLVGMMMSQ